MECADPTEGMDGKKEVKRKENYGGRKTQQCAISEGMEEEAEKSESRNPPSFQETETKGI